MNKLILLLVSVGLLFAQCKHKTPDLSTSNASGEQLEIHHKAQPDWVKNAVIYEVNTRQFSKEGTFAKVEEALPRIKALGVDIVWFMPIHEIGLKNRKLVEGKTAAENLGSYYSVKDYRSVNPEFGTKEDFKRIVDKAHSMGMKVIIDWVPNHTAWDHPWITEHPEYYTKNAAGEIIDPIDPGTGKSWGWTDVADLNYDNKDLWNAMNADMAYWVTDFDIDGFRCDVAGAVPAEFWKFNNPKLEEIKPLFMLAEAHERELLEEFNMLYSWNFMGLMNDINEGKKPLKDIITYMEERDPADLYMYYTANHDENTWNDAPMKYKENYKNFAILCYMMGGMPLIYNGQEADINHKLEFFVKDEIQWTDMKNESFFKGLNAFYKNNSVLWNALNFGTWKGIESPEGTLVFSIDNDKETLLTLQNYTNSAQSINVNSVLNNDSTHQSVLDDQELNVSNEMVKLKPFSTFVVKVQK